MAIEMCHVTGREHGCNGVEVGKDPDATYLQYTLQFSFPILNLHLIYFYHTVKAHPHTDT